MTSKPRALLRLTALLAVLAVILAACAPTSLTPAPSATAGLESPPAESTLAVPLADTFTNPVLKDNFADPFILKAGDTYWAYATNSSGKNISLAKSSDLVRWTVLGDAMPALPKWAKLTGGLVWAPEVIEAEGRYVMYYTARDKASDKQCVGASVSDKPEGKFKDMSAQALVCQSELGGTIDASPYRDADGKLYLYYKNDGNCCGIPTIIYVQEMSPDGLSLLGEPVELIRNDKQWEGHVIEAPTMWKQGDAYYLFYSANNYAGHEYAVGYAVCESPLGPCEDAPENPILASDLDNPNGMVIGPGHQTLLQVGDQTWIIYHAWEVVSGSRRGDRRLMWMDRIVWEDGKPVVQGPTTVAQPRPLP